MNLPNYFLADLPAEATLTQSMLSEACQTLKRNRNQYLANRSTESLINILSNVAGQWLENDYPFRILALEQGPASTGFSRATLANGLDSLFRQMTADNFQLLLEQDFGHARRLDELCSNPPEKASKRASIATAPEFLVHITAGNLPNPALQGIAFGLLLRSAQFVKCASRASLIPRLFAHSLYDADPKLGACLEVAEWRGGNADLERSLFAEADCVTATCSDETLSVLRKLIPATTRFVGYGHRVSFAFVSSSVLTRLNAQNVATLAARDVAAWNQLGCLSPHVLYIETGGHFAGEQFAALLAEELERREAGEPRGDLPVEVAAAIASRRSFYEVRAAHSPDTRHWCSKNSTAWTVVFEADPQFHTSCLNRFIYVKSVSNLKEALQGADSVREQVSTVGLATTEDRAQELATELARWGATRVCPLGQMQNPPLTWRHDGRPALADLITWTDWER